MAATGSSLAAGGAAAGPLDVRGVKVSVLVRLEERAGRGEPLTAREQALLDQSHQLLQTAYDRLGQVWRPRLPAAGQPGLLTAAARRALAGPKLSEETQRRLEEQGRLYKEMRRRMSPSLRRKYKGFAGWSLGNYMRVFGRLYRPSSPPPVRLLRNTVGHRRRPGAAAQRRRTASRRTRAGPGSDPDLPDEPPASSGVAGPGPASRRARAGPARRVVRRGRLGDRTAGPAGRPGWRVTADRRTSGRRGQPPATAPHAVGVAA